MWSDRTGVTWILFLPMIISRRSFSDVVVCRATPDPVSINYFPVGILYFRLKLGRNKVPSMENSVVVARLKSYRCGIEPWPKQRQLVLVRGQRDRTFTTRSLSG